MGSEQPGSPVATRGGANIHVTILDENRNPLKQQSVVRLTSQTDGRVLFQTTRGAETSFNDIPGGKYLIEVGAAGYLGTHKEITVGNVAYDLSETVTLLRDPAAVDLTLRGATQLPAKARKEAQKGVQALELSNLEEARKHLEAADHEYPSSSTINFLLGYMALQQRDQAHELSYLTTATKLDPHNVQAQNLLGQLYYERGDYAQAAEAEEIVVASSPDSVIARKVLANSCLKLGQFEKARDNSQWLVDHGGNEEFRRGWCWDRRSPASHNDEAAILALKKYLEEQPGSSVAPQVRTLLAQLEAQTSKTDADSRSRTVIGDPELTAESDAVAGNAGMPSDIDAQKPAVAPGPRVRQTFWKAPPIPRGNWCPAWPQFSAIEHMVHENLTLRGVPTNREQRQFNYVAAISEPTPGALTVQDVRDSGDLNMPDKITTTGLPVLAIAFHPLFRDDFEMHCEGLSDWSGQATWLVHFRQLDNKPTRLRAYVVNGNNYPVALKGRAWIRADNYQIAHLETDLVRPIPEIRLFTEHTSVTYGPVQFKKSGTELWLPKNADLYVHYAKRRFHRSESFDHFMLFTTDSFNTATLPKDETNPGSNVNHGVAQPQMGNDVLPVAHGPK